MAEIVNGRCHAERAPQNTPPLIQNGKLVLQGMSRTLLGDYSVTELTSPHKHIMYAHNSHTVERDSHTASGRSDG